MKLVQLLKRFVREEEGVTAIEYGLLSSLIAVAMIPGLTALGVNLGKLFLAVGGVLNGQPYQF